MSWAAAEAARRAKIAGKTLDAEAIAAVIDQIVEGGFEDDAVADFLIAAADNLTEHEVVALAIARERHAVQLDWPGAVIADKHSLGGVPGNRLTPIVVPIVAAAGFTIPKTSSRAITSPAGTADAMEVLARVDLTGDEVRRTVERTGGCVVWNGRLSQSPLDEVMNAITRPMKIDSRKLSVASILSKKRAAGATHVVVDIPVGPGAKVASTEDGNALAELFRLVGFALGMEIDALVTDGTKPIGYGIGPALEMRDVAQVLENAPDAPPDLRDKALHFAGRLISLSPEVETETDGVAQARLLIRDGLAKAKFDEILDAQGRHSDPVAPGEHRHDVVAPAGGTVTGTDIFRIATVARTAGAPVYKGAGLDLHANVGDTVDAGQPLYTIHAETADDLDRAVEKARADCGVTIGSD